VTLFATVACTTPHATDSTSISASNAVRAPYAVGPSIRLMATWKT
jgi:hypothetical protein